MIGKEYQLSTQFVDGAVTKLTPKQFNAYREEQDELRKAVNIKCTNAGRKPVFTNTMADFSRFHVVPLSGGNFKIVRREKQIAVMSYDNNGNANVIAGLARTHSDRLGLSRSRGKYNDADNVLLDSDAASIELGEVQYNGGDGFY